MSSSQSIRTALAILGLFIAFFAVGTVFGSNRSQTDTATQNPDSLFQVVTRRIDAQPMPATLALRGRTEAFREVIVRAETQGRVLETPATEGTDIGQGDIMCRIDLDARGAALAQAEADLRARQLDYDAALELQTRGHRSATQVASVEAARDAASARLQATREDLANTQVRAPFDGFFDRRLAETGDYLRAGDACGVLVQLDPILLVAEVSERDISGLNPGLSGRAELVTGETVDGVLRRAERRADPATRTFRIEIEAPNPDQTLRSGVTANIELNLEPVPAFRIPTSTMSLNSDGDLGVRIVVNGDTVRFIPVELVRDDGEMVWVSGLPDPANVIIRGQDFVADGARVDPISDTSELSR